MKSKTRILLVAIVALSMISMPSFAQLKLGLKGEVGLNKPTFSSEAFKVENMNVFKVGPSLEAISETGLGLDISVLYSNEKMEVKDFKTDNSLFEVESHYLDVPLNLKFKIAIASPLKVYLATGPYAQFRVAGDKFNWDEISSTIEEKKFQAGVNVGLGAEIINSVQLGVNYRLKLTDDYSFSDPKWEDLFNENKGFWSISATIYF
ncbi:MAG TPA: PorT family protein [Bacteroidales bacterium]|nr:PorT family protein [Bacteroidales bacterium]